MPPTEHMAQFIEAKKLLDETLTLFNTRLMNLLNYYLRSRDCKHSFEKLFDLTVADRLNEALAPGPLEFVLMKEGTDCLTSDAIADLEDLHVDNKVGYLRPPKAFYNVPNHKIIMFIMVIFKVTDT